jgi:hypothetical protein
VVVAVIVIDAAVIVVLAILDVFTHHCHPGCPDHVHPLP